jgi:hypothetical protein
MANKASYFFFWYFSHSITMNQPLDTKIDNDAVVVVGRFNPKNAIFLSLSLSNKTKRAEKILNAKSFFVCSTIINYQLFSTTNTKLKSAGEQREM